MKGSQPVRLAVALAGLAVVVALARPPPKLDDKVTLEVVPNPLVLKVLGASHVDFMADLFWVRMANMAGRGQTSTELASLLPIGNLIADLSPRFKYPYFVGGVMAPVRLRSGEWRNVEGALALMSRGLEAVPDFLRLYVQKAYTQMEILKDPAAAGQTLKVASAKVPNAPVFVAKLAARLLTQGGRFDDAREYARAMATAEDPEIRADFEHRLKQIDLEQVLRTVEDALERFRAEKGRAATSVDELVALGFLPGFPVDPFGGRIELSEEGPRSTVESRRLRAYVPLE